MVSCNAISFLLFQTVVIVNNNKKSSIQLVKASSNLITSAYRAPFVQIFPSVRNEYNVKEGGSLTLSCKATGHPQPHIRWTILGRTLFKRNLDIRNATLSISKITRSERGRVTCKAWNGIGNPSFSTKRINVIYLDKPTLTIQISGKESSPKSIWDETTVYFQCAVLSYPPAAIKWMKYDREIVTNAKAGITVERIPLTGIDISTNRLTIKNAEPSDFGRYSCVASLGRSGARFKIDNSKTVFVYNDNTASPKIQIKGPSPVIINKGDSVKIMCSVLRGVPDPTVTWTRQDGRPFSTSVKTTPKNQLVVSSATYNDTGTYVCTASNGVGIAKQQTIDLYVRRLGVMTYWITPQRFRGSPNAPQWRLSEDSDVRITCQADADPSFELNYTWYKVSYQRVSALIEPNQVPGLTITENKNAEVKRAYTIPPMSSRLEIQNLSEEDYGIYKCSATLKGFRNASATVNASIVIDRDSAPSQITAPENNFVVTEGSDLTLSCEASSVPKPLILFYREENMTMPSGREKEVRKDGKLRLTNITRNDGGMYFCKAARYNGFTRKAERKTQALITVDVQYPPSVEPEYSDIRKARNSDLDLSCYLVEANPGKPVIFEWFKDGRSQGKTTNNNRFRVLDMDASRFGVYRCNVSNSVGFSLCVFNVTNRPYEPEFYYDATQESLSSTNSANLYTYKINWTQRLPKAVESVISYKIRWRDMGDQNWKEDVTRVPNGAKYGQLLSYSIRSLKTGVYQVEVVPFTRYGSGDLARRIIEVYPRILREVTPTRIYDLDQAFFCTFSSDRPCNFKQPITNDINWILNSADNLLKRTIKTGPTFDHTDRLAEGPYMFIESSKTRKGDTARLVSPLFMHSTSTKHCLKFYYHMRGKHIGRLRVLVSDKNGNEMQVWSKEKEQGDNWMSDLISFSQDTGYRVIFEATILQNNGYLGDIAIDDVSLEPSQCVFPITTTITPLKHGALGGGAESSMNFTGRKSKWMFRVITEKIFVAIFFCFFINFFVMKFYT